MAKKAFTIVELIVVITILSILLVVGVVNLRSAGTVANDEERKTDVTNFAKALEDYYLYGNTGTSDPYLSTAPNQYPNTTLFLVGGVVAQSAVSALFPNLDSNNYLAPGVGAVASTLVMATNATATTAGVTPQPTTSQYIYQPIASDATLCDSSVKNCRKFYIYYKLETDSLVYQIASKNK